ncbi:UDP-glucose 4-epimerase [Apostichopus japonicus]|uniref:UDP-glucose 4-epimerase n=1 Tax=Stichopus japonicus TaxID=307972 RepID=A0A2G8JDR1_STIJA|nr:UDP-glucose 4-epimerase [Apostichopus japonicus]
MASSDSVETVLVTGGAGYIGSHTVAQLLKSNYEIVVLDNFSNAVKSANCKAESICRVEKLSSKTVHFYNIDLLDMEALRSVFLKHRIDSVIHFAGLKAVGESNEIPLKYYRVNIGGTVNLLDVMKEFNVVNIVFSSSATVYGTPDYLPIDEKHPVGRNLTNCYGRTKYFLEQVLTDVYSAEKDWNVVILRYFNPVGSHKSGEIGEILTAFQIT